MSSFEEVEQAQVCPEDVAILEANGRTVATDPVVSPAFNAPLQFAPMSPAGLAGSAPKPVLVAPVAPAAEILATPTEAVPAPVPVASAYHANASVAEAAPAGVTVPAATAEPPAAPMPPAAEILATPTEAVPAHTPAASAYPADASVAEAAPAGVKMAAATAEPPAAPMPPAAVILATPTKAVPTHTSAASASPADASVAEAAPAGVKVAAATAEPPAAPMPPAAVILATPTEAVPTHTSAASAYPANASVAEAAPAGVKVTAATVEPVTVITIPGPPAPAPACLMMGRACNDHVVMESEQKGDPMSFVLSGSTPAMEPKYPDRNLLQTKLGQIMQGQSHVQLAQGERVLLSWDFEAKIFDPHETIFNVITLGLYGCVRMAGVRKRNMHILLTDRRVLVKEELYMKVPAVKEEMWEAQQAMNLADLSYVRLETGTGSTLKPDYFLMDLHFLNYPTDPDPPLYQSVGSRIFKPLADIAVVAFDNASGGLVAELKKLKAHSSDPSAMLAAIQQTTILAYEAANNPAKLVLDFIKEFLKECASRFIATMKALYKLMLHLLLGLVPIAALAAKLWSGVDRETDANVLRLSLYRPDDEDFLSHAENFLKQVVARRDVLLKEKGIPIPISNDPDDPAIHPYCFAKATTYEEVGTIVGRKKGEPLTLPSCLYGPVLNGAHVLAVAPMNPTMSTKDVIYTVLSFGIYYLSDLQGLLQHKGALVLTNKSLSVSSIKSGWFGKGLDHARLDMWLVSNVNMHALNSKKNLFNDEAIELIIGCDYGSIVMNVGDLEENALTYLRRKLSEAMDKTSTMPIPDQFYQLSSNPEIARNLTVGMLETTEVVISIFKCRNAHSTLAKYLTLGMAEHSHTLCIMTNYRIIYRSVASNCRGKRRQWEASIPISAVRSVFWSNFYHRKNKILAAANHVPGGTLCTPFCMCCPFTESDAAHFWMGEPGVSLRLLLGSQRNYGAVMSGHMVWFCGSDDALTKSIAALTNVQYALGVDEENTEEGV